MARLAPEALIVDIRGNPGGHIPAAETTLQLLSAGDLVPTSFSLATTPLALELCRANPGFEGWVESIQAAVETGETYSQAFPLSDPAEIAGELPRYAGPKVLITDALCYSAADLFAAGLQDNGLGPILGTADLTGAGGANVWTHELLRMWLPDALGELPAGAGFRVALRRATRANEQRRRAARGPRRARRRRAPADPPRHHAAQPGPARSRRASARLTTRSGRARGGAGGRSARRAGRRAGSRPRRPS